MTNTQSTTSSLYIGLMSGTSADAVDAALVSWPINAQPELIGTFAYPIPTSIQTRLFELNENPAVSLRELALLDSEIARVHAQAVVELLQQTDYQADQIAAIGFHGQTIDHAPEAPHCNSTQIGNPHLLASMCGITVIGDVRRADIAAGGQGAPLAPALHAELFRTQNEDIALVNIGGIANVSLLPKKPQLPVIGFDTGPGNCLMDDWCRLHLSKPYDKGGQFAAQGIVQEGLLDIWLQDEYFSRSFPKSSGRDLFNLGWLKKLTNISKYSSHDVQASLCALTVETIADAIEQVQPNTQSIYICGGGAFNDHLMQTLQRRLSTKNVATTADAGIDPNWVEALLMAWLARQFCTGRPSNLPSVTGANHHVKLGVKFTPPSR